MCVCVCGWVGCWGCEKSVYIRMYVCMCMFVRVFVCVGVCGVDVWEECWCDVWRSVFVCRMSVCTCVWGWLGKCGGV